MSLIPTWKLSDMASVANFRHDYALEAAIRAEIRRREAQQPVRHPFVTHGES